MKDLEQTLISLEKQEAEELAHTKKKYEEKRLAAARFRGLIPRLSEAGIEVPTPEWDDLTFLLVNLGQRPRARAGRREFARKLRAIRALVGPLVVFCKDVDDPKKKLVRVELKSPDWPNLYVTYRDRLRKDSRCRIVRQRRTTVSLVCEAL